MTPASARGRTGIDLVESAFHLLRRAPASALSLYAVGAVPFLIGLLVFAADMTRSSSADARLTAEALGLVGLFLWLKVWQAAFGRRLRGLASGQAPARTSLRRVGHDLAAAAAIQTAGLFLVPTALVILLPFGWVFAFFQSATVDPGEPGEGLRSAMRVAARRARVRPRQNHGALVALLLTGWYLFMNIAVSLAILPYLARSLFGIESAFTRSGFAVVNSTFFAVALAATWLCLDPLVKAIYVLRAFEADAARSGDDLRADWRLALPAEKLLAGLLLAVLLPAAALRAEPPAPPPRPGARPAPVDARELDRSIARVLERSEYSWRNEVRAPKPEPPGFLRSIARFFDSTYQTVRRWWRNLRDRLDRLFGFRPQDERAGSGTGWITSTNVLLLILAAAVVSTIAIALLRRRRRTASAAATAVALPALADTSDDGAAAAELPEEAWRSRAQALAAAGDFREAARALYLGCLAFLAGREAISLARFKSNREYIHELGRRLRREDPVVAFADNVFVFERVWYGRHGAGPKTLERLGANLDRLKAELP